MPEFERRRPAAPPRVAHVEDWDDEAGAILPGSRTSANVAVRRSEQELVVRKREGNSQNDPFDSGYVSRADTLVSEPTSTRRKTNDLKIETAPVVLERERQPYHMPQATPVKPPTRRQSSSQTKESTPDHRPKVKHVHERGTCQTCDRFGFHVDLKKDIPRASSMAPPQPPSPTSTRHVTVNRSKDDDAIPQKTRRSSSVRQQRPLSVVTNSSAPPQYPPLPPMYGTPVFATTGWPTPMTPVQYATVQPYGYAAPLHAPPPPPATAPATPQYPTYQPMQPYYEPPMFPEPRSAKPSRRSSPVRRSTAYGDPVIRQGPVDSGFDTLDRVPSRDNRPNLASHKSSRSIDQDKFHMPPPPKPQPSDVVLARRPSNRRAKTYHPEEPTLREQPSREPLPLDDDYDEYLELRPTISNRGRRDSPSLPPNSYRAPVIDPRPVLPRKSVSYSTPDTITKVASSKSNAHRRTTLSSIPMEQKEADAEAYQQKRSSVTPHLTVEALRNLDKGTSGSRSETGSSYSHQSHQSSSKDSSRGRSYTSGAATSITLPGGLNVNIPANFKSDGRPLSIHLGEITLSMKSQEKELEKPREQKRIERAPSVASKASRRSIASSNISNTDPTKKTSRRPSQLEERAKISRQHSRAPSATGHSLDYAVTSRRQSVEFSNRYEDYYGA